ncbi:MAG: GumC family protein [Bacteroidota bacterium]
MPESNFSTPSVYKVTEILDFLKFWRRTILLFFGIATAAGLIAAFLVSRQYKSVARVIPPKESNVLNSLSGMSSLMRSLPVGIGSLGGKHGSEDLDFIAVTKSRTVQEEIVTKFDLKRIYEVSDSSMEKTLKIFQSNIEIDWTEENVLEIRVWDEDSKRAMDIANYYVELLNRRSYELYTNEARYNRLFIEQRVEKNKNDLKNAEEDLKAYQEKTKTFIPPSTDAATMSGFGELVVMKTKKEIEAAFLKKSLGEQHPQYQQVQMELETLDKKMSDLPNVGLSYFRLIRQVLIQQKIMETIIPLYEQAKINEHKDIPAAYILDSAIQGERPDRPKRSAVVAISSFMGLLLAGAYILYKIHFSRQ